MPNCNWWLWLIFHLISAALVLHIRSTLKFVRPLSWNSAASDVFSPIFFGSSSSTWRLFRLVSICMGKFKPIFRQTPKMSPFLSILFSIPHSFNKISLFAFGPSYHIMQLYPMVFVMSGCFPAWNMKGAFYLFFVLSCLSVVRSEWLAVVFMSALFAWGIDPSRTIHHWHDDELTIRWRAKFLDHSRSEKGGGCIYNIAYCIASGAGIVSKISTLPLSSESDMFTRDSLSKHSK